MASTVSFLFFLMHEANCVEKLDFLGGGSCFEAYRILASRSEMEPLLHALEALAPGLPGKPLEMLDVFFKINFSGSKVVLDSMCVSALQQVSQLYTFK